MSKILVTELYDKVDKHMTPEQCKLLKTTLDKYLAKNADKYTTQGPSKRPIFSTQDADTFLQIIGLTSQEITAVIKKTKAIDSSWKIMNNPVNTALALVTRVYISKKKIVESDVTTILGYTIVSMYPSLHYKYFKYEPNEAIMAYTINNLSNKFGIKQTGILWESLMDMMKTALNLHEPRLKEGTDKSFIAYIQDVKTRLNSFIKKISNEFYDNEKSGKYLNLEHEDFNEETYYEETNNSYNITKLTNKVVTTLVVNGPDMKLIELSAKTNKVSINATRNYVNRLINEKHRQDIWDMTESILYLYLFSEEEHHDYTDVHSTEFMIYCLKLYKRSNTTDKNVIRIKNILNKWTDELDIKHEYSSEGTINDFKRAFFTFFVLTIQKSA